MNDPAVSAAVKKLQDTITELSMAVTQKITYDVIQNTALKIKTQTKAKSLLIVLGGFFYV